MSFINLGDDFANVQEAVLAPEGQYDLLCRDAKHDEEKHQIAVFIDFDGEPDFQNIFHNLFLPNPDKDLERDKEKGKEAGSTGKFKMLMIKRFCHTFNIPLTDSGFDVNDIVGARARLGVVQDTYERDDGSTVRSNKIKIPNLPEETGKKKK